MILASQEDGGQPKRNNSIADMNTIASMKKAAAVKMMMNQSIQGNFIY
jgi:hypothetical protein